MSTPPPSETPRTDAETGGIQGERVDADFACALERELNEARKDAEDLAKAIREHQEAMTADDTSVFAWENIKTKSAALDAALAAHATLTTTKGNEA